ncbi:MAG: hypothetical protein QM638_15790 [Nocardioides sp.]|uniref:hypothetical protein n=1 Tax=Nocardioides sp. TaxID=35761 RepID=UPI0039E62B38
MMLFAVAGVVAALAVVAALICYRENSQEMLLPRTFREVSGLSAYLERLLGAEVLAVQVVRTDTARDETLVRVSYARRRR